MRTNTAGTMLLILAAVMTWAPVAAAQEAPADTAVSCDPEIARLVRAAGDSARHGGADGVVIFDRSTVRVEENGRAHVVRRRLQKALAEAGAARLAVQRFDYDPATSLIEVRRAVVHRANGACEAAPTEGIADLPQPAVSIYWGLRMKLLPIPRPAVGDAVETETYFTGFQIAYLDQPQDDERFVPPMRGHYYDTVLFGDEPWPTTEKSYSVTTPRDRPLEFETYGPPVSVSVTFDDREFLYAFQARNLRAKPAEPTAPDPSDYLSKVVMATVPDWREKSRWFFHANEAQFEADAPVRAMVDRIVSGLRTDEERVAALNRWVAHHIRYRGFSLGPQEGYTMQPGSLVFANRAGVCKDKAGMLVTMMRALGYQAYPAMTMAGSRVERIAADQFNHAVVAWRLPDGAFRMLDPTWAPFSRDVWSRAETDQHYVIGTAEGQDLEITPREAPDRNGVTVRFAATLDAQGNLDGTVRIEPVGWIEDRLRRKLGRSSTLETRAIIEEFAGRLSPGSSVASHRLVDPFDIDRPFFLEFGHRIERHASVGADTIRLAPAASRHPFGPDRALGDYVQAVTGDERASPVLLRAPQTVSAEERIALPAGFDLAAPVERRVESDAAAFEGSVSQEGRTLVIRARTVTRRRNVSTSEYAGLAEAVRTAREFAETPIVLRRSVEQRRGGAR